jgi:NAD(P)H-flavin reductase
VGRLTTRLFSLAPGAQVGLRGPFGRGFPDGAPDSRTVYVAGGCGLSPLKSAIDLQRADRSAGTPVAIVYGAREPSTHIHRAALAAWAALPDVHVVQPVERCDTAWPALIGVAPDFAVAAAAAIGATHAAICGPAAMMGASARQLASAGLAPDAIHLALERRMHCGVGECGHCYLNQRYVCTDGPVFSLAELGHFPTRGSNRVWQPDDVACRQRATRRTCALRAAQAARGAAYQSTAKKWQKLPARTKRCQTTWL